MQIEKEITSRDNSRNIGNTQYSKEIVTQLGIRIISLTPTTFLVTPSYKHILVPL